MSARRLHIGKGAQPFSLPLELVTSTQAILARKRSGKSYTASVEAEELLATQQQIAVIDPTSAWWGLRSSADGLGEGFRVAVFGGDHADAPLDFRAGKAMAAAMVEHGFSAIFDIGNLHTEEQVQFVMDFCSELLRINRAALHVFMDEADTFAPQKPLGLLQNKCLGTVSRLVKQGGIRGIGFTMITQRPASMNKDVLSQVDILTVLRMSHPLDIRAATDWIKSEVSVEFAKTVETALPGLPVGTAFFCSASLKFGERVEVRARTTFNSGATPKPGERKVEPKVLAKIDIAELGERISASVKRSREESPEFLKKRVAELEAAAAIAAKTVAVAPPVPPALSEKDRETIDMLKEKLEELAHQAAAFEHEMTMVREERRHLLNMALEMVTLLQGEMQGVDFDGAALTAARGTIEDLGARGKRASLPTPPRPTPVAAPRPQRPALAASGLGEKMGKALRSILNVLAQHGPSTKNKIAALTGYAVAGGGFGNALSEGRTKGWLEGSDPVRLTEAGAVALGEFEPLPSGPELLAGWLGKLGKAEREVLSLLAETRGTLSKDDLAAGTGYAANGGGFGNALSRLRTLELIEGSREIALAPDFAAAIQAR